MRDPNSRVALDQTVAAAGAPPSNVIVLPLDVQSQDSITAAVSHAFAITGNRLDAVIACAGILVAGPFEATPLDAMRDVMEVNYFGLTETVRATLPGLRATHGRIVLISSDSGFCGTAGLSGYTASKFAVEGWGESIAHEVEPLGVRLSIIEPGPFASDIFTGAQIHHGQPDNPYAPLSEISEASIRSLAENAPSAEPVVAAVMRALSARDPRLRYPVGREARLLSACRRLLPELVFRRIARRMTGMQDW